MRGLIVFIVAKLLILMFYPIGFVYSIGLVFFKHGHFNARRFYCKSNSVVKEYVVPIVFIIHGYKAVDKYLFECAIADDQSANTYLAKFFNDILIKVGGHRFGCTDETISSVLGRNILTNTLSPVGKFLNWVLDKLDPNHSIKSIGK